MDAGLIDRIETNVERVASALFGGAVGLSSYLLLRASVSQTELLVWTVGAVALAILVSRRMLIAVGTDKPRFSVTVFDIRELEPFESDELLLTDSDRVGSAELVLTEADQRHRGELLLTEADEYHPGELLLTEVDRCEPDELLLTAADLLRPASEEPLVLDDILAELGPDARVVRLFDRQAMPTPGQLKSRIDSHLEQGSAPAVPADASKALSEALAQLRRSLR
jgi:hypothetical protein